MTIYSCMAHILPHLNIFMKNQQWLFDRRLNQFGSVGSGLKNPQCGQLFSSIFDDSRKNNSQASFLTFAPRLYNSYYHAHTPGLHMWPSPGPTASGLGLEFC